MIVTSKCRYGRVPVILAAPGQKMVNLSYRDVSSANVMSLTDWWLEVQLLAVEGEKAEEENTALSGTGADDLGVEMRLLILGFLLSDRKSVIHDRIE